MTEKILVPVLGESITEATISKWLKNIGESYIKKMNSISNILKILH